MPVIVWEAYLFDELALVADGSQGGETTKSSANIVIAQSTHPLAAGFADGPVSVYTTPQRLSYGRPAPAAEVVAHEPGHQQKAVIFAYGAGAPLADGSSAPAVRVALFPDYAGAGVLTQQGIDLVDAALAWALPTV